MKTYLLLSLCFIILCSGSCHRSGIPQFSANVKYIKAKIPAVQSEVTEALSIKTNEVKTKQIDRVSMPYSDIVLTTTPVNTAAIPYAGFVCQTVLHESRRLLFGSTVGDIDWFDTHFDKVAIVSRLHGYAVSIAANDSSYHLRDSALHIVQADDVRLNLRPVYKSQGAAYLGYITDKTDFIPWKHNHITNPDLLGLLPTSSAASLELSNKMLRTDSMLIDMQSITRMFYKMVNDIVSAAIDTLNVKIPGGGFSSRPNSRLYYVPQSQFAVSGNLSPLSVQVPKPGWTFIYSTELTYRGIINVKLIFPITTGFNRVAAGRDFDFVISPLEEMVNGSANPFKNKLLVNVESPAGITEPVGLATIIRDSIQVYMSRNSAPALTAIRLFLSTAVGRYLKSTTAINDQSKYDIYTIRSPFDYTRGSVFWDFNGVFSTQVQPEDAASAKIRTYFIEN